MNGPVVVLLHGWPYDIHSFVDVAPLLASAGYRVLMPHLRGYGTTRFLSSDRCAMASPRRWRSIPSTSWMRSEFARATIAGFDWGARTANIVAALWPERCKAMVSVSGYLIGNQEAGKVPLSPEAELQWWYQYYFSTERGRLGYERDRHAFAKLIWQLGSPKWSFDDATFSRSAASLDNPDHVAITIHNYRWRLALAPGRSPVRRVREAPCGCTGHQRTHDHAGRRCQRRAAPEAGRLRCEVLGKVLAPDDHRRRRPQPPSGSTVGLCASGPRRRRLGQAAAVPPVRALVGLSRRYQPTRSSSRPTSEVLL